MTVADLKIKIFREVDSLEKNQLEEFYGILNNFLNSQKDVSDWEKLSETQRQGIFDAIDEIESGKGTTHEKVITKFRKKYTHV